MSNTPTLSTIAKLGAIVGSATITTKREFYDLCAAYIGDKTGKARTAQGQKIHDAIARVGKSKPPSVGTITKFAGFAARFKDLPHDVNLEIAAKFAAQAGEDATFDYVDNDGNTISLPLRDDVDAVNAVNAYNAHLVAQGLEPMSIRTARDMFDNGTTSPGAPTKDAPLDVADVVTWLLSQPKAVVAWLADNPADAAELVALLTPADAVAA